MKPTDRILVALDVDDLDPMAEFIETISPYVGGFKVGHQLATNYGAPQAVRYIHDRGGHVFLDLKFHDIPNTVAASSLAAARLQVRMFNTHASGGSEMMRKGMAAAAQYTMDNGGRRPLGLGVTVLTSMNDKGLEEIGYHRGMTTNEQVLRLAKLAYDAGLDGVVASAREARMIREEMNFAPFVIVTPAIQPDWADWAKGTDQKRPTTHIEAMGAGATYIVVGRAILRAPNPIDAAKRMADEIAFAA